MPYPYRIHEKAYEEYIEAYEWYEQQKPGLGNQFMECVEKKLQQISEHPEFYSKKQNLRFREAKVYRFPYLIVYEFFQKKRVIHIVAIYHEKRHIRGKYRRIE